MSNRRISVFLIVTVSENVYMSELLAKLQMRAEFPAVLKGFRGIGGPILLCWFCDKSASGKNCADAS
jgi:hypothetical protein